jgi:pimeloyl-ACP methyl ester carboxylesterase
VADGTKDVVVPPANSRVLAKNIPGARLRFFRDAGHAFLVQYHRTFSRVVSDFLD